MKLTSFLRWSLSRLVGALATSSSASGRSMPDEFVALWSLMIFIIRSWGFDSSSCRRFGGVSDGEVSNNSVTCPICGLCPLPELYDDDAAADGDRLCDVTRPAFSGIGGSKPLARLPWPPI